MEIKKIAIFAGSFDPITNGHLDIIKRASKMFDKLIVLIAVNPNKKPYFDIATRLAFIKNSINDIENVSCDYTSGLTTKYAKEHHAKYLVRGVRNINDFDYEVSLSQQNKSIDPSIETIFLVANQKFSNVSSSDVICRYKKKEDVSSLIPSSVKFN